MIKKQAKDLKKGDKIEVGGEVLTIEIIEISDSGKQGKQKCRIEALKENKEKVIIIRPSDYPLNLK